MKTLLPSLKEKQRYVVFEIDRNVDKGAAKNDIERELLEFLGELTYGKAGIQMIPERFNGKKGIIRTDVKYVNEVKMGIGLVREIGNQKVKVQSIGVSGTMKKAEIKFMEVD